ncbi:hypothetical protein AKJ09_09903 [Labilithrix luteola]|uniref:Uncharacterized protein n=1 Tax=Labilithrix luteola TaxID=1391654 RepID=A0A0K1QCV3_9BACT|nr:hypothetical protein AKJ09_09903 [Labilithrix luteola]
MHHGLPRGEVEPFGQVAVASVRAAVDAGQVAAVGQRKANRSRRRCALGRVRGPTRPVLDDTQGVHRSPTLAEKGVRVARAQRRRAHLSR